MRRSFRLITDPFPARLSFVAGALLFLMLLLAIRLFVRSVVAHPEIRAKAEQQYLVRQEVEPRRGMIYATTHSSEDGLVALARDRLTYSLSVVPRNLTSPEAVAEALAAWVQLSSAELLKKISNDRLYLPPLRRGLSDDEKTAIMNLHLAGVFLEEESERYYPEGALASQVLGFVNAERRGNYGVEQFYDEELRGSGGEVLAERDVRGRLLWPVDAQPVRDGAHLILTLDRNIQGFVETTLKNALQTYQAESGSIVVMDVRDGSVLAMANQPDFNPNTFRDVPAEEIARFTNPAIGHVWEPGSIFKTIVMAAALDAGVIEPDTEGVFSNVVVVGGYDIHTAEDKAFGRETMTQVLENSDNVGMVWVANQLGNDRLAATLEHFGLGQKLGIDLPGEAAGTLPPVEGWRDIHRATISFGQGVATTPLQMVSAMSTLANGGKLLQPHLVRAVTDTDGKVVQEYTPKLIREGVISAEASAEITAMMVSVVERGHGKRAGVPGYKVAGKTGTAQIPNPEGGYFEDRHIGGFGGFFPADNPRFAMIVKLDQPKTVRFAESSAAPTFGEIARYLLQYYKIPPTEPID